MHVINWEKQASIVVGTGKYLKKKKIVKKRYGKKLKMTENN